MHPLNWLAVHSHRDAAGKPEGKGFKKKGPRQIWSKLSARDHAWYLHNQGDSKSTMCCPQVLQMISMLLLQFVSLSLHSSLQYRHLKAGALVTCG